MLELYCNKKFDEIQLDTEKRLLYNCCKAFPERLKLKDIEENLFSIFVTKLMIADREKMLKNKRFKSCDYGCFNIEDNGRISYRIENKAHIKKTTTNIKQVPKRITIILGTDCNLTCMYCTPDLSSAWRHDLDKNGNYNNLQKLTNENKLALKLKQKQRTLNNKFLQLLIQALNIASDQIEELNIMGGEPMLNNSLPQFLEATKNIKNVQVVTGLGVSNNVFQRFMSTISNYPNLRLCVSGESIGKQFEFIRYGNTWKNFLDKIDIIKKHKINFNFLSTLNNISLFNFIEFTKIFKDTRIKYQHLVYPTYQQSCVLDNASKDLILKQINDCEDKNFYKAIETNLQKDPTEFQRQNCAFYLKEFANRRNLNLDIFPASFLAWLNIN